MKDEALQTIIIEHRKWLCAEGGTRANLRGADLRDAVLCGADLRGADLCDADLCDADLCGTGLCGANLRRADLRGADLCGANLREANLRGTCLDPNNTPNGADDSFVRDDEYVIGYRTEKAGHIDQYRVGRFYSADWFSTADTECHPGLYLWPTLDAAYGYSGSVPMIRVRTRPECVHKAGTKYRCQWFEVLEVIAEKVTVE
jgi:hypothetical protein